MLEGRLTPLLGTIVTTLTENMLMTMMIMMQKMMMMSRELTQG